jgi:hypothetical protein
MYSYIWMSFETLMSDNVCTENDNISTTGHDKEESQIVICAQMSPTRLIGVTTYSRQARTTNHSSCDKVFKNENIN